MLKKANKIKKLPFILTVFFYLLGLCSLAQETSCYKIRFESAMKSYNKGYYQEALKKFSIANSCTDVNKNELESWSKKCNDKVEAERKKAESGNISTLKNQRYVDSLKKVIALKYKWGGGKGNEATQLRYIKACGALADYFIQLRSLRLAAFYYKEITSLSAGTDSDLGENSVAIDSWNKYRIKLAKLYKSNPGLESDKNVIFDLLDNNQEITDKEKSEFSQYLFKKDLFVLTQPNLYTEIDNTTVLLYLFNPLYITEHRLNEFIKKIDLEKIASYLRNKPLAVMSVEVKPHKLTVLSQNNGWDILNKIINNLVGVYGISEERLMPELYEDDAEDYNGVKVWSLSFSFKTDLKRY